MNVITLERRPNLAGLCRRMKDWVFLDALPFWSTIGVDGDRGFIETLDLDGKPKAVGFKRTRVHARQIYVFSHAYTLGFDPGLRTSQNGLDFLIAHGWLKGGGWAVSMGENGGIVNSDLDLYDQAFVLLAFAWWTRATGKNDLIPWIDRTLQAIDDHFGRLDGEGWKSRVPDDGRLLQNPHMHMFEALLAVKAVHPTTDVTQRIRQIALLFQERLFDPTTGTIAEYYDEKWSRIGGDYGHVVEPGHHFEWYWLLRHAEQMTGHDARDAAERLFAFAQQYGVDSTTGLIHDELLSDGSVRSGRHRSWPQTERLKALLARAEFDGVFDRDCVATVLCVLLDKYLGIAPRGCWIDHLDVTGRPCVSAIPASTLYHLFLATAELMRLERLWAGESTSHGALQ
ncbi:AGE family epimerase/isomerase [Pararhizobium sp. BT-229]|uniref:AGE family epimerase/isomerase n=1 Tax=Pararhizobium sp. BT-229 TaxID=2986923 RepID=UPI0021F77460|nr:AGE family epimerase/isomerase [Pararhizobium sp. BT-229]MCV9967750.1 AGE family epimerase/isomerase [Pararhizobium sp. BT-229]